MTGAGAGAAGAARRPDLDGLRALALAVLFAWSIGWRFAPGGFVGFDVFLVIAGFLVTRSLIGELERPAGPSLARFYAGRVARTLPALAVVLVAVLIGSQVLLGALRNQAVADDVITSALFVVNWRFIAEGVDVFGAGIGGSPVEHLWSLAVAAQFVCIWAPCLLAATWWWRRRGARRGARRAGLALAAGVGAASFAYCVAATASDSSAAYFSTLARAWEPALGAVLALAPLPRISRDARPMLTDWLGLAGLGLIAYATVELSSRSAFPGTLALLPALGAAALIAAGRISAAAISARLLGLAPLRYIGRISYAWFLWFWPALVLAQAEYGPLSTRQRALVICLAVVPAVLTHHALEAPLRRARSLRRRPARALALAVAGTAAAIVAALALVAAEPEVPVAAAPEVKVRAASEVRGAGALAEQPEPQRHASTLRPNPLHPERDRSQMQDDDCLIKLDETVQRPCVYGDRDSETTVVLFGDSLAMAYFPAIDALAKAHHWRLVGLTKAGCPPVATTVWNHRLERDYRECATWRGDTLRRIERDERPALILVTGRMSTPATRDGRPLGVEASRAALERGYVQTLRRLRATGARVVALKDLPHSPHNIPDCVVENRDRMDRCAFRSTPQNTESFDARAVATVPGVQLLDMTPVICPGGLCRAVIGDAIVFRDYDHMTPTFARTLAPIIDRQLPAIG